MLLNPMPKSWTRLKFNFAHKFAPKFFNSINQKISIQNVRNNNNNKYDLWNELLIYTNLIARRRKELPTTRSLARVPISKWKKGFLLKDIMTQSWIEHQKNALKNESVENGIIKSFKWFSWHCKQFIIIVLIWFGRKVNVHEKWNKNPFCYFLSSKLWLNTVDIMYVKT